MKDNGACHQAFSPSRTRLEIRLFPAVTTYKDLKNRLRLVHYCLKNPFKRYSTVIENVGKEGSRLNTIIKSLAGDRSITDILKLYFAFSKLDVDRMTREALDTLEKYGINTATGCIRRTREEWKKEDNKLAKWSPTHRPVIELAEELGVECV